MTIETNRDQADVLLRLALEDNRDGHWQSALEHVRDAIVLLDEIAEAKSMAALDRRIAAMADADLEELLQGSGIK